MTKIKFMHSPKDKKISYTIHEIISGPINHQENIANPFDVVS